MTQATWRPSVNFYTVVLRRLKSDDEDDYYVAHVQALNPQGALTEARGQVLIADRRDGIAAEPGDYGLAVMFDGYQMPRLWGFQIPKPRKKK